MRLQKRRGENRTAIHANFRRGWGHSGVNIFLKLAISLVIVELSINKPKALARACTFWIQMSSVIPVLGLDNILDRFGMILLKTDFINFVVEELATRHIIGV